MPKPDLHVDDRHLESEIIATMRAGLGEWRPDLSFPESVSDMQACVRGLLRMFKVERLPLNAPLRYQCSCCEGIGHFIKPHAPGRPRELTTCEACSGRGYKEHR